jgi:hypothetical protein
MSRHDELLQTILSHPRDSVVSIVLVAAFAQTLVDQYPSGDSAWQQYLRERPVEDAVSLYLCLAMYPSNNALEERNAKVLADRVLASSLGVRQAIAEEPPYDATDSLMKKLHSITSKPELMTFLESHPELLDPSIDVIMGVQSLAVLWKSGSPERAAKITVARDNLRFFRTMQDVVKRGTMLARRVNFFADPARPYPVMKDGDSFDVIALPDLLYLADSKNGQARLSIPWGDINLNRSGAGKREKNTAGRAWADVVTIFTPVNGEYEHEGLVLTYYDPERRGEYKVFFRLYGENEINKLLSAIITWIDDYRLRGGYIRYP